MIITITVVYLSHTNYIPKREKEDKNNNKRKNNVANNLEEGSIHHEQTTKGSFKWSSNDTVSLRLVKHGELENIKSCYLQLQTTLTCTFWLKLTKSSQELSGGSL